MADDRLPTAQLRDVSTAGRLDGFDRPASTHAIDQSHMWKS